MEEILHQLIGSLSYYLQGFLHQQYKEYEIWAYLRMQASWIDGTLFSFLPVVGPVVSFQNNTLISQHDRSKKLSLESADSSFDSSFFDSNLDTDDLPFRKLHSSENFVFSLYRKYWKAEK